MEEVVKQFLKFVGVLSLVLAVTWVTQYVVSLLSQQITRQEMVMATMTESKVDIQQWVSLLSIARILCVVLGGGLIFGLAWVAYKKQIKAIVTGMALMSLLACSSLNVVDVTPPYAGIVVEVQTTGNQVSTRSTVDLSTRQAVEYQRISINMVQCALNSDQRCSDKVIYLIDVSPKVRQWTPEANRGSSSANEGLCFAAQGSNGCVGLSMGVKVPANRAGYYANQVGTVPDPKRPYVMIARDPDEMADKRVLPLASSMMSKAMVDVSPIVADNVKFSVFDEILPALKKQVETQFGLEVTFATIDGGIVWDSAEVQRSIDLAITAGNEMIIAQRQNQAVLVRNQGVISVTRQLSDTFGLDAAIRIMLIQKWGDAKVPFNGGYIISQDQNSVVVQATPTLPTQVRAGTVVTSTK